MFDKIGNITFNSLLNELKNCSIKDLENLNFKIQEIIEKKKEKEPCFDYEVYFLLIQLSDKNDSMIIHIST